MKGKNAEAILLTGPSVVGRTTLTYEMIAILKKHQISHALIDTDELDRLYPEPTDSDVLYESNLKAVWTSFANRGCERLILCAVLTGESQASAEITNALGADVNLQIYKLTASKDEVRKRLIKREVGSLLE